MVDLPPDERTGRATHAMSATKAAVGVLFNCKLAEFIVVRGRLQRRLIQSTTSPFVAVMRCRLMPLPTADDDGDDGSGDVAAAVLHANQCISHLPTYVLITETSEQKKTGIESNSASSDFVLSLGKENSPGTRKTGRSKTWLDNQKKKKEEEEAKEE